MTAPYPLPGVHVLAPDGDAANLRTRARRIVRDVVRLFHDAMRVANQHRKQLDDLKRENALYVAVIGSVRRSLNAAALGDETGVESALRMIATLDETLTQESTRYPQEEKAPGVSADVGLLRSSDTTTTGLTLATSEPAKLDVDAAPAMVRGPFILTRKSPHGVRMFWWADRFTMWSAQLEGCSRYDTAAEAERASFTGAAQVVALHEVPTLLMLDEVERNKGAR
jgi:hypothetical protein